MHIRRGIAVSLIALLGGFAMAQTQPALSYFGRASVKIVTATGFVIYVDPYAPGDYAAPADLVLVTHGHDDHNDLSKLHLAPEGLVAAAPGALSRPGVRVLREGEEIAVGPVRVKALPAYNRNHSRGKSLGYLIRFDGLVLYHAGDTSLIPEMSALAAEKVDYALLPTDGKWNMGGAEAGNCADAIQPRFVAAIHSSPDGLFDAQRAALLDRPNAIRLEPGQTIPLEPR